MKKYILNEDFVNEPNVAVIGDGIAYLLDNSDLFRPSDLIDPFMTVDQFLNELIRQEPYPFIDYLFFSIGSNDLFNPDTNISELNNELVRVFPKAELFLMKGYIDIDEFNFDDDEWTKISDDEIIFYNIFEKDRVEIVGDYDTFGDETLSKGSIVIRDLRGVINNFIKGSSSDFKFIDDVEDVSIIKNKDLNIDDETDYDTIYEFLDNFNKIVKSNNTYNIDTRFEDIDDVKMLKIALSFLGYGDLSDNGFYDEKTEESVKKFQLDNNINSDGESNNETIEEIFYELKVHGFDQDDLGKFLGDYKVEDDAADEFELENKTSSEFKNEMSELGIKMKNGGSDIDSGGQIDSKFLGILTLLFKEFKKNSPSANIVITSGNDKFHHSLPYTSLHTKGKALDLTLDNSFHGSFIKLLNNYKSEYPEFGYIDEYNDPSEHSTGPHFHLHFKG